MKECQFPSYPLWKLKGDAVPGSNPLSIASSQPQSVGRGWCSKYWVLLGVYRGGQRTIRHCLWELGEIWEDVSPLPLPVLWPLPNGVLSQMLVIHG